MVDPRLLDSKRRTEAKPRESASLQRAKGETEERIPLSPPVNNMTRIEEILQSDNKPKEKQTKLAEAVVSGKIPVKEFMAFFESAKDTDKGACAGVMKHVKAITVIWITGCRYRL